MLLLFYCATLAAVFIELNHCLTKTLLVSSNVKEKCSFKNCMLKTIRYLNLSNFYSIPR